MRSFLLKGTARHSHRVKKEQCALGEPCALCGMQVGYWQEMEKPT